MASETVGEPGISANARSEARRTCPSVSLRRPASTMALADSRVRGRTSAALRRTPADLCESAVTTAEATASFEPSRTPRP